MTVWQSALLRCQKEQTFPMVRSAPVLGVPIAVSLAGACLMLVLITGQVPNIVIAHRMINGIDSFPLLAIRFFIFAGSLVNNGGITERIFNFAKALMGWMRGGLGHVNVGASIVFSGMSGAAVADAGGLGMIEVKAMKDAGYDEEFALGITAASSPVHSHLPRRQWPPYFMPYYLV